MTARAYAWASLLGVSFVAILLGWQAQRFEIDASADTLLTRGNEIYLQSRLIEQQFSPEEFVLVAFSPQDYSLFSERAFGALRELTAELETLERVADVRSILNVPLPTLAATNDVSELRSAPLTVDDAGFAPEAVAAALVDHPIYEDLLIDEEQTVTALQVVFRPDPALESLQTEILELERRALDGELSDAEEARLAELEAQAEPLEDRLTAVRNAEIERMREIVSEWHDEADVYLGGVHVLSYQLIDIVRSDLVVFGTAVAVLVALLLLVLFRQLRWLVIAFACCASGILCSTGLFALTGLEATVISANFIALQLILTLAMVVHLVVQYREYERCEDGGGDADPVTIVRKTMRVKTPPIIYTGVTTAIGFAALLASGIQPVISFGLMMIIAMFVSMAIVLLLFPALALILARTSGRGTESRAVRSGLAALAAFVSARQGSVLAAAGVFLALCVAGLVRLELENSFINYFDEDTDVFRELTFIDRQLGGSTPLDVVYSVPPAEGELLLSAEAFQDMQKLDALFEQHDAVGKILSPNNFTEVAREVNEGRPLTEYEVTAMYRLMDEDLRESLFGAWYSPETQEVRFSLRIEDTTEGLDRAALLEALRQDVEAVLGDDADYRMASLFVLYQDILERLFRSQVLTLGIVFAAITIAFLVIFRSLRVALIALVPNVLVTATVFGVMGWFGIALDLMTITIAAVAMGIAVDNTIHYIHRFREERETGSASEAVRATHTSVGVAVFYTTVIIVAGFASFVFSDFVPSTLFGVLTAVALGSAFLFDVTVLPALLGLRKGGRPADGRA